MENRILTEIDSKIHQEKIGWYAKNFAEDGYWDYKVLNQEQYVFALKNGELLKVTNFEIVIDDDADIHNFLLAEIDETVVGYLFVSIVPPKKTNESLRANSDVEVLTKGKGIGSHLEAIKQIILQRWSNNLGEIENEICDENSNWVLSELKNAEKMYLENGDIKCFKKIVDELFIKRQSWLMIYGNGGKGNYKHNEHKWWWGKKTRVISKKYLPGSEMSKSEYKKQNCYIDLKEKANEFIVE